MAIPMGVHLPIGYLPIQMTTEDRDAIGIPPESLLIYNLTTKKLNIFTTVWEEITSIKE